MVNTNSSQPVLRGSQRRTVRVDPASQRSLAHLPRSSAEKIADTMPARQHERALLAAPSHRPQVDERRPETSPLWIEVDLSAIRHNMDQIRRFVGPSVKLLAVVKANAYGHGEFQVARTLVDAGVDLLGVASVTEGVSLRQRGVSGKILVLGQILPEEAPLIVENDLIQSVGDLSVSDALNTAAAQHDKKIPIHLKIDTGMGRYGVWHEEAVALARRLQGFPNLSLEGTWTHLAMAGQNVQATEIQLDRFVSILKQLHKEGIQAGIKHAANSVGLLKFPSSRWDMVRTGLLLYGASPVRNEKLSLGLQPSLSLKSRIRLIKTIPTGQTISYGGTYQAARPTRVATIPVGYAHGYTRALSGESYLLVRGQRVPVIGKITMEDLMVDVTDVPHVRIGDEVVLIGRQGSERITVEELAVHAKTIPYEILTGLSPSIHRFYLNIPEGP